MIRETGTITAVDKSHGKRIAYIECVSKSACSSCNCGMGSVSKIFSEKKQLFTVPYEEGMEANNLVEVQINNDDLIKSAMLIYLVPLFFFICSALIAKQFQIGSEGLTILIAIIFAAVGFAITRVLTKKLFPKVYISQMITSKTVQ